MLKLDKKGEKEMSKYTVDNKELKEELIKYINSCTFKDIMNSKGELKKKIKNRGKVTPKLGKMIKTIAEGLSTKGNWRNYTWKEDFVSQGILICLKYMHNFNPEKYDNAHGYINMICYNAFVQYVKNEKNHSYIKQELYDKQNDIKFEWDKSINYEELKNDKIRE